MQDAITTKHRSLLLCLDLERDSTRLARFAAEFAAEGRRSVYVLCVETRRTDAQRLEKVQAALAKLVTTSLPDTAVASIDVVPAEVAEDAILAYAASRPVDMIVLGHRQDEVASIHVGSTTKAVVSLSPIPVLVMPLRET